jgi:hypothetical protein
MLHKDKWQEREKELTKEPPNSFSHCITSYVQTKIVYTQNTVY